MKKYHYIILPIFYIIGYFSSYKIILGYIDEIIDTKILQSLTINLLIFIFFVLPLIALHKKLPDSISSSIVSVFKFLILTAILSSLIINFLYQINHHSDWGFVGGLLFLSIAFFIKLLYVVAISWVLHIIFLIFEKNFSKKTDKLS